MLYKYLKRRSVLSIVSYIVGEWIAQTEPKQSARLCIAFDLIVLYVSKLIYTFHWKPNVIRHTKCIEKDFSNENSEAIEENDRNLVFVTNERIHSKLNQTNGKPFIHTICCKGYDDCDQ